MTGVTVVINPVAGSRSRRADLGSRIALAERVVREAGCAPRVVLTVGPGHAAVLAREAVARGDGLVVAWGGDGTVHEVGGALALTGTALGIVPSGSGNGLAGDLGLPYAPGPALRVALHGTSRAIDAGEIDGELFFNLAGVGLDAEIAAQFAARPPGCRGLAAYTRLTLMALLRYQPQCYLVDVGGERLERRAILVAFANSRQYGHRALIAPRARLDDGLIDVVVVEAQSLARIAVRLPRLFTGALGERHGVVTRPVQVAEVACDREMPLHVDGEPRTPRRHVKLEVRPHAVTVRVPCPKTE